MAHPKNVSWRLAALGLLVGVLAAAGALALVSLATPAAPSPAPAAQDDAPHGDMAADARCAHMPEHCPPEGGS